MARQVCRDDIAVLFNYVHVEHGWYTLDFTVWVLSITSQKLQDMKLVVEDEADLAQKLFDVIFKEDSENRQNDVCCTEADGKEQLNII